MSEPANPPDRGSTLPRTSIEQWGVLAAVVDRGGYAQAAEQLHRSQSAVSYAVAKLQEALGVDLLRIAGRKAVLTPHGETLLKRARPLIGELGALEKLAHTLQQGWEPELRLAVEAAFPRTRLLGIVGELQRLCPHTQMQLSEVVLSGAEEAIRDGSADVVITTRVPAGFLGHWLLDVNFMAVAHAQHPLFELDRTLTAGDLMKHVQAVIRDSGQQHPRDEGWLGSELRCTVTSMEAALAIVAAGLAYAWLPAHLLGEALQRGTLRPLPLGPASMRKVPLSLVLVSASAGPAARAAVECFERHAPVAVSSLATPTSPPE